MKTGNAWTRWRKVLAAIAVVASGMCSAAMAYTETVDGVVWTYSISEGTAIVEKASPASGSLTIPSALGGVPVTRIKYYAFDNCYNLTSVTIPDSVISIEAAAFSYCSCLTNVTFGIEVKRVQGDAFRHCEKLSSVHIRDLAAWCGISFKDFNSDANPLYPCYFNEKNHTISPGAHLFLDGVAVAGNLVIPDGVGSIANNAFCGLTNVTSVVIPTSVTNIGEGAFRGCGLTNALIPGSVRRIGASAFSSCSGLASVKIPDSVESIERYAFSGCRGLTNLTLGNGLRSIGEGAFEYCSGLMRVKIPDSVVSIGKSAFSRCLSSLYDTSTLPGVVLVDGWAVGWTNSLAGHVDLTGVRGISAGAFSNCTALASVAIPGTMKEIGNRTFADCTGLRNVAIPDSVESIGGGAFYGCSNLTSVAIPDSVESMGDGAFGKCPSLYDTQTIPGVCLVDGWALEGTNSLSGDLMLTEVRGIAERAFYNCSNLTSVTIGNAVKSIGYATFRSCYCLDEVVIPETVREIGDEAFAFCYSLNNVVIPDGVKSIGNNVFSGCYLTNASISSSVRIIGDYAFVDCAYLRSATICDGVETIGEGAFYGCDLLSNLTIPESTVNIGWDAFQDCKMLKWLYVPASREETWALVPKGVERDKVVFYRTDENGGVPWRYAVLDGVATVVGSRFSGGDLSVPETLADYPVKSIGAYAFSQCRGLTNVTLPDSVTNVGYQAFWGSALATLHVPASWEGTDMLSDAAVPEGCAIVYVPDPKPQSLAWAPTGTGHVPGDRVVLSATAGGGGEVQFEVVSGPGVLEGKTLSFTAAGSVTVRAFLPGDENWLPVEETREVAVEAIAEDGRRVYADLAANYPGGWGNGSNGGEGFGAWRFDVRDGSGGGWAGGGIWDPSANGFIGTWTGKTNAFGLIGKGDGFSIRTYRPFMRALAPGDSFSLEMAVNWDSNMDGAEKGFALTAGGADVVVVNHGSYPGNISVNGDTSYDAVNVYGLHPMAWTFTVVDGNTLRFTATGRDDPANAATGILKIATSAIDGFRLQSAGQYALDANQWEGDCRQSYYDDFRLFLAEGGTEPSPVSVPQAWLEENAAAILEANGGDPEAAASAPAANGLPVWKCYVAGLSTTNAEAAFKVKSISVVDGEVNVEWYPDLNGNGTPNARAYTVEGKSTMADAWGVTNASSRFFRVKVELPE